VKAPTSTELARLAHTIARRFGRFLERKGWLTRDAEDPYRESLPRERSECFGHGTTHVIFEPLDFIARLAALAPKTLALLAGWALPKPRVNLTRFHGVFAPNSKHRAVVTPARRGKGNKPKAIDDGQAKTPAERRASMT
jgi:hypothetical protein